MIYIALKLKIDKNKNNDEQENLYINNSLALNCLAF